MTKKVWRFVMVFVFWGVICIGASESYFRFMYHEFGLLDRALLRSDHGIIQRTSRHAPHPISPGSGPAVFFFGGSFTYGRGLPKRDAFSVVFESARKHKVRAINLALPGRGANQMLRFLELKSERKNLKGAKVEGAVYTMRFDHIVRSGRGSSWDPDMPYYELKNKHPVYHGTVRENRTLLGWMHSPIVRRSYFLYFVFSQLYRNYRWGPPIQEDYQLYTSIVRQAHKILKRRYAVPLTVLIWNGPSTLTSKMACRFQSQGMRVVTVDEVIPDIYTHPIKYQLSPNKDVHPTAFVHRALGEYFAKVGLHAPLDPVSGCN